MTQQKEDVHENVWRQNTHVSLSVLDFTALLGLKGMEIYTDSGIKQLCLLHFIDFRKMYI